MTLFVQLTLQLRVLWLCRSSAIWRVCLKRGVFRGATIGVFEAEGGYPRLFEESPSPQLAAEQTGGGIEISSVSERDDPRRHGTRVTANFNKNNIDFTPLGDIVSTVTALIQGAPGIEWRFIHETPAGKVELDTRELRQVLGDVPLDNFEVIKWVEDYLKEGYASLI